MVPDRGPCLTHPPPGLDRCRVKKALPSPPGGSQGGRVLSKGMPGGSVLPHPWRRVASGGPKYNKELWALAFLASHRARLKGTLGDKLARRQSVARNLLRGASGASRCWAWKGKPLFQIGHFRSRPPAAFLSCVLWPASFCCAARGGGPSLPSPPSLPEGPRCLLPGGPAPTSGAPAPGEARAGQALLAHPLTGTAKGALLAC